jgi:Family of unknown function (DUF6111)
MLRLLSQETFLFLLPFGAYAMLLVARQRLPFLREAWSGQLIVALSAAGLTLAIIGLLALGLFSARHRGAYQPAHLDHERLIQGHME